MRGRTGDGPGRSWIASGAFGRLERIGFAPPTRPFPATGFQSPLSMTSYSLRPRPADCALW